MAFSLKRGTGFGSGNNQCDLSDDLSISASYAYADSYGARLLNSTTAKIVFYVESFSLSSIDIGCWYRPQGLSGNNVIQVNLDDGKSIQLRLNTSGFWDLRIDGVLVDTGTVRSVTAQWQNIQIRIVIADSGTVDTRVNEQDDISYSGDTKPGTGTIASAVYWANASWTTWDVDCLAIGTGGWPGSGVYYTLLPNADTAVADWDPSTGSDLYAMVDEQPASDSDYIYSDTDADEVELDLTDAPAEVENIVSIIASVRAWKVSGTEQLIIGIDSGGVEDDSAAQVLQVFATYLQHAVDVDPNTSLAWTNAALDSLKLRLESVI